MLALKYKTMRRVLLLASLFLKALTIIAQTPATVVPDPIKVLLPQGYLVLRSYDADLNADSLSDKILVLTADKSLNETALKRIFPGGTNLHKRPVIILLRQADQTYKRITRNDQAIVQDLALNDPFTDIICATGMFTIEHINTDAKQQCTIRARFEWMKKQNDWYLKEYSQTCISVVPVNGADAEEFKEKTPKNFGKIPFGKFKYPMSIEIDEWGQ
jgi:hypothetical protein